MHFARSSQTYQPPRTENLKIPKTTEEFDNMSYNERLQLCNEHPVIYNRFARRKERKPWEE